MGDSHLFVDNAYFIISKILLVFKAVQPNPGRVVSEEKDSMTCVIPVVDGAPLMHVEICRQHV